MPEEKAVTAEDGAAASGIGIEVVRTSARALEAIFGDTFRQLGGISSDWAAHWRYRNTLRIADKVAEITRRRSMEGKLTVLPEWLALPLLESASLEAHDEIQDLWAALIANASDPSRRFVPRKVYIEILRGLEPLDAKIMQLLGDPDIEKRYGNQVDDTLNADVISRALSCDPEDARISIQSLARHGLVIDAWENTWGSVDYGYSGFRVNNPKSNFRLSHLGQKILAATSVA